MPNEVKQLFDDKRSFSRSKSAQYHGINDIHEEDRPSMPN